MISEPTIERGHRTVLKLLIDRLAEVILSRPDISSR